MATARAGVTQMAAIARGAWVTVERYENRTFRLSQLRDIPRDALNEFRTVKK